MQHTRAAIARPALEATPRNEQLTVAVSRMPLPWTSTVSADTSFRLALTVVYIDRPGMSASRTRSSPRTTKRIVQRGNHLLFVVNASWLLELRGLARELRC